jgi:hypothetical protein
MRPSGSDTPTRKGWGCSAGASIARGGERSQNTVRRVEGAR